MQKPKGRVAYAPNSVTSLDARVSRLFLVVVILALLGVALQTTEVCVRAVIVFPPVVL